MNDELSVIGLGRGIEGNTEDSEYAEWDHAVLRFLRSRLILYTNELRHMRQVLSPIVAEHAESLPPSSHWRHMTEYMHIVGMHRRGVVPPEPVWKQPEAAPCI